MKIIASNKSDLQPYNKSIFKTTHNSYHWSITKQLDQGIRGFELDIHDFEVLTDTKRWDNYYDRYFPSKKPPHYFKVGHLWPGNDVYNKKRGGNPWGNNLEHWLRKIADWSRKEKNREHAPITVFLDIKKNLIDKRNNPPEKCGLIRFNEQIRNACGDRLVTPKNFDADSSIKELRNKIIVVLMSFHTLSRKIKEEIKRLEEQKKQKPMFLIRFYKKVLGFLKKRHQIIIEPGGAMKTRIAYQKGSIDRPICHVAFNPEDRDIPGFDVSLEKNAVFVTTYDEKYSTYQKKGKLVRTDYLVSLESESFFQKVIGFLSLKKREIAWPQLPENVNFPATDYWEDNGYQEATTEWVE